MDKEAKDKLDVEITPRMPPIGPPMPAKKGSFMKGSSSNGSLCQQHSFFSAQVEAARELGEGREGEGRSVLLTPKNSRIILLPSIFALFSATTVCNRRGLSSSFVGRSKALEEDKEQRISTSQKVWEGSVERSRNSYCTNHISEFRVPSPKSTRQNVINKLHIKALLFGAFELVCARPSRHCDLIEKRGGVASPCTPAPGRCTDTQRRVRGAKRVEEH